MLNTISYAQIFLDMAVLVDAQGDLLDNIETQVFYQNLKAWGPHESLKIIKQKKKTWFWNMTTTTFASYFGKW